MKSDLSLYRTMLGLKSIFVRASMNGWSCQSEHHMELGNMGGTVVAR